MTTSGKPKILLYLGEFLVLHSFLQTRELQGCPTAQSSGEVFFLREPGTGGLIPLIIHDSPEKLKLRNFSEQLQRSISHDGGADLSRLRQGVINELQKLGYNSTKTSTNNDEPWQTFIRTKRPPLAVV